MAFPLERITDASETRFNVLYYSIIYAESLSLDRLSVIGKWEIVAEGETNPENTVNGKNVKRSVTKIYIIVEMSRNFDMCLLK